MRIAVTGASGYVGGQLVPLLAAAGHEIVTIGRDVDALRRRFPSHEAFDYAALEEALRGCSMVVHLAVANSESSLDAAGFEEVNVRLAVDVATAARSAGVPLFVYVSSVHALDEGRTTLYAETKRRGATAVTQLDGIEARVIYLGAVHGQTYSGRLGPLNGLPQRVVGPLFSLLSAVRPTCDIHVLADYLGRGAPVADDAPVVLTDDKSHNRAYVGLKRLSDIAAGLVMFVLGGLVLLPLCAAIRLESRGPAIFRQRRVGQYGREFTLFKLRTMRLGTPQSGTHEVPAQAVTRIGAILRRTKIDELPQFVNLLKGDISLVGPRPSLRTQTELVEARQRAGVLAMPPGVTGLSQIRDIDMSDPNRLALSDAEYGALRSLALEVSIVIATAKGSGRVDRTRASGGENARAAWRSSTDSDGAPT